MLGSRLRMVVPYMPFEVLLTHPQSAVEDTRDTPHCLGT